MAVMCEICGERRATTTIEIDGVVLRVCSQCAKFGKEVVSEVKEKGRSEKRALAIEKEEIVPDFAEKIRRARESLKLSRKELAEKIGEKATYLEKVEEGKTLPTKKLARKLERLLGIKLLAVIDEAIYQEEGEEKKGEPLTLGDIAVVRVKKK